MQIDSAALPALDLSTPATGNTRTNITQVFWQRMLRALRFDRLVYPDIESDPRGTRQAAAIVDRRSP